MEVMAHKKKESMHMQKEHEMKGGHKSNEKKAHKEAEAKGMKMAMKAKKAHHKK
jgi:hypothetical protein